MGDRVFAPAYYAVTPLGGRVYLSSRLALPVLWSVAVAPILILAFSLSHPSMVRVLAVALTGGLFGAVSALLLLAFAGNKVEGLAVSKMLGLTMLVPYLTDSPWAMVAGLFPAYWIGALMKEPLFLLPLALAICTGWLYWFYRSTIARL